MRTNDSKKHGYGNVIALGLCAAGVFFLLLASNVLPNSKSAPAPALHPASANPESARPFIAYAGYDPQIYYWRVLEDAAHEEARRRGLFFVSLSSLDRSAETQTESLLRALKAGADGLVVGITPSGMDRVFAEADKRGVPVVVVNEPANSPSVDAEIYTLDISGAGVAVAHFLATPKRPAQGRILVLTGDHNSKGAVTRGEGFRSPLEAAGYTVDLRYCEDWSAQAAVKNALESFQDSISRPVAAFAAYEVASVALGVAAMATDMDIPLYGYDISPAVVSQLERRLLTAVVNQDPEYLGRTSIQQLDKLLKGEPVEQTLEHVPSLVFATGRP